jgi:hypothetical protein
MTQLEGTSGDIVETGVWNGGSIILMVSKNCCVLIRAQFNPVSNILCKKHHVLAILGSQHCTLWAADSFQGLPPRKEEVNVLCDGGDSFLYLICILD